MNLRNHYDYAIGGGGASGLSLAYRMAINPFFQDKKIVLIEKTTKNKNDRTWCFWSDQASIFDSIVAKEWEHFWFRSPRFTQRIDLSPYRYKMIRGLDFYEETISRIKKSPHIDWLQGSLNAFQDGENGVLIETDQGSFTTEWFFNGIPEPKKFEQTGQYNLKQHFKGWVIESEQAAFDPETATFMDFRIEQENAARFFYLLPTSPYRSLVEFTLFSPNLLEEAEYDRQLRCYIQDYLGIEQYSIAEEEFSMIPMSDAPLSVRGGKRILNLGMRGGQTKPSSGYTFQNIQRQSEAIIQSLQKTGQAFYSLPSPRYRWYDSLLLNVMLSQEVEVRDIFARLFQKHPIDRVLRFLDEESTFREELLIMAKMPSMPFMKAFFARILRQMG